ncbi:MAG: hypothetical protein QOK44_1965 [Betaproteobacteria bacterium]|jgi:hypothetical protein|nr:hypothetical protein [Betaproteobacteria bacterium]
MHGVPTTRASSSQGDVIRSSPLRRWKTTSKNESAHVPSGSVMRWRSLPQTSARCPSAERTKSGSKILSASTWQRFISRCSCGA